MFSLTNSSLILSILNAGVCVVGDELVKWNTDSLIIRAICDNLTHAICGLFSILIILLELKKGITWYEKLCLIGIGVLVSSFIDLDHFLAAKTLKLSKAIQLIRRPFLHCTTIPLVLLILQLPNNYLYHSFRTNVWLNILSCAFLSHHTRDANRRGFWIYPFGSTKPLPYALYIFVIIVIPFVLIKSLHFTSKYHLQRYNVSQII